MDAKIARVSDSRFFGTKYSHAHRSRDWAPCNQYLGAFVVPKVVARRTQNDMAREIPYMLQNAMAHR